MSRMVNRPPRWRHWPAGALRGSHGSERASRRKVTGIAVSITARVAGAAAPREVLVTTTVRDLVAGSGIALEERGEREFNGVPATWSLYAAR